MLAPDRFFNSITAGPVQILDPSIALQKYVSIDLSIENIDIKNIDISDPVECQTYINGILKEKNALVAYGGYLEKRNLYEDNPNFSLAGKPLRNIHLGIDFWSEAGTKVMVPIDGTVHSFKNNASKGDYGPTIVLEHDLNGFRFHTLYGHLSLASQENLFVGKVYKRGDELATLGTSAINVNYATHLHFQVIIDMEGKKGDYFGVCSAYDLKFYIQNCPDPNSILKM